MKSMKIDAFLSCSFLDEDNAIVEYIKAVCDGLDINCIHVDRASENVPPDEARKLIYDTSIFIAVATKKSTTTTGTLIMPSAVREEISMAYALEKPILLIAEENISLDGFMANYCTYMTFSRNNIKNNEFISKLVSSLHNIKLRTLSLNDIGIHQSPNTNCFSEYINILHSLDIENNVYVWNIGAIRKTVFTGIFNDTIKAGCWSAYQIANNDYNNDIIWNVLYEEGNKEFRLTNTVHNISNSKLSISTSISPPPQKGDYIIYSTNYKSPLLAPIYLDDIKEYDPEINYNGKPFYCCEGLIPIQRVKKAKIQFRFPKPYWKCIETYQPIVGSHSSQIDYIVDSEIARMTTKMEDFGISIIITCEIESPLLHHNYGIAWNPPERQLLAKEQDSRR